MNTAEQFLIIDPPLDRKNVQMVEALGFSTVHDSYENVDRIIVPSSVEQRKKVVPGLLTVLFAMGYDEVGYSDANSVKTRVPTMYGPGGLFNE